MVIKASSRKEIEALVADLSSDHAITRDGALARLTVIGSRALERLIGLAADSTSPSLARIAAFHALEAIAEPRALQPALAAFTDPDPLVVVAALGTARAFLATPHGLEALDRVIEIALDRQRSVNIRIAAIQALVTLPEATVKPVLTTLKGDADPEISNLLQPARRRAAMNTVQRLEAAAAGTLPAEPAALKSAIAHSGHDVALATLHQVVQRIRVHEGSESSDRRAGWMAARAATHLALAERGSRLALYDLRESIESARERIPVEFFAAVTAIGDASCLEGIAHASARANDDWSRRRLAEAFRAIVDRENLTRRHALARKIEKRWPGSWQSLVVSRD